MTYIEDLVGCSCAYVVSVMYWRLSSMLLPLCHSLCVANIGVIVV